MSEIQPPPLTFDRATISRINVENQYRWALKALDGGCTAFRVDIAGATRAELTELLSLPVIAEMLQKEGAEVTFVLSEPFPSLVDVSWRSRGGPFASALTKLGFAVTYRAASSAVEDDLQTSSSQIATRIEPIRDLTETKVALSTFADDLDAHLQRLGRQTDLDLSPLQHLAVSQPTDNVHMHSGTAGREASVGLLGYRYAGPPHRGRGSSANADPWRADFLNAHFDAEHLEIAVVDSGVGLTNHLRQTIEPGEVPTDVLDDDDKLLRWPFEHRVKKRDDEHLRAGLYDTCQHMREAGGMILARTSSSSIYLSPSSSGMRNGPAQGIMFRAIAGTQLTLLYPLRSRWVTRSFGLSAQPSLPFDEEIDRLGRGGLTARPVVLASCRTPEVTESGDARHWLSCYAAISAASRDIGDQADHFVLLDCRGADDIQWVFVVRLLQSLTTDRHAPPNAAAKVLVWGWSARRTGEVRGMPPEQLPEGLPYIPVVDERGRFIAAGAEPAMRRGLEAVAARGGMREAQLITGLGLTEETIERLRSACDLSPFFRRIGDGRSAVVCCAELDTLLSHEHQREVLARCEQLKAEASGHFRLPSGRHAGSFVHVPGVLQDRLVLLSTARAIMSSAGSATCNWLLSHGALGVMVGECLLAKQFIAGYALTTDYGEAAVYREVSEASGAQPRVTLILTPAVRTGSHLARLWEGAETPRVAVAVFGPPTVDAPEPIRLHVLVRRELHDVPEGECALCSGALPLRDTLPFHLLPWGLWEEPVASRRPGFTLAPGEAGTCETAHGRDDPVAWDMLDKAGVLKRGHHVRDGRHYYTWYDDTEMLVSHAITRQHLRYDFLRFMGALEPPIRSNVGWLLHPDHLPGTVMAHMLAARLPTWVQPVALHRVARGHFGASPSSMALLNEGMVGRARAAILVDDTANTGSSLAGMAEFARRAGLDPVGAYVGIDLLDDTARDGVRTTVRVYRSCFCLSLPIYTDADCPACQEMLALRQMAAHTAGGGMRGAIENRLGALRAHPIRRPW